VGWQLGFGQIARTLRFGAPSFDTSDLFEFNGQLLVEDASNLGVFRTQTESFAKIVHTVSGDDDYWTVNFPDGRKARFGFNQESRIRKGGEMSPEDEFGPVAQWLLSEIEDTSGNVTRFSYDRSFDPGTGFPKAVEYTYRDGVLVGEKRSVEFILEDRPDIIYGFPGGVETRISKRVREIRSLAGNQVYRRLVLGYASPATATTQRSRLTSAQVFGTDCPVGEADPETPSAPEFCNGLPAKTFAYTDASDVIADAAHSNWIEPTEAGGGAPTGFGYVPELISYGFFQDAGRDSGVRFQDINGDGLVDFVASMRRLRTGGHLEDWVRVYLNDGTGWRERSSAWEAAIEAVEVPIMRIVEHYGMTAPNYEMITDLLPIEETMVCGVEIYYEWVEDEDGEFKKATRHVVFTDEAGYSGQQDHPTADRDSPSPVVAQLLDLNGDGLADILLSYEVGGFTRTENTELLGRAGSHIPNHCGRRDEDTGEMEYSNRHNEPSHRRLQRVWLNTGAPATGWELQDEAIADQVPPFYSLYYRTEQGPTDGSNPDDVVGATCGSGINRGDAEDYEQNIGRYVSKIYHQDHGVRIADLNGDGRPDFIAKRDPVAFGLEGDPEEPYTGDGPRRRNAYPFEEGAWLSQPDDEDGSFGGWEFDDGTDGDGVDYTPPVSIVAEYRYIHGETSHPRWVVDADAGVRFVDLNGDGLDDLIKTAYVPPEYYEIEDYTNATMDAEGVWLNTGSGWCGPGQPQTCPDAQERYLIAMVDSDGHPVSFVGAAADLGLCNGMSAGMVARPAPTGLRFVDLNGDGFVDLLSRQGAAWIHDPSAPGANGEVWVPDPRFDLEAGFSFTPVNRVDNGARLVDVDGDGSLDYIRRNEYDDYYGPGGHDLTESGKIFESIAEHPDLLREVDNGQGGTTQIEYTSAIVQRDLTPLGLEYEANADVGDAGLIGETRWSPAPVVRRITTSDDLEGGQSHATEFAYARPQWDPEFRSSLGFRLVETTHLDDTGLDVESTQVDYFWQQPGIAGQRSRVAVYDSDNALRSEKTIDWEVLADSSLIAGSIADVNIGRPIFEFSAHYYGDAGPDPELAGAEQSVTTTYDDSYGYNFAEQVEVSRATSALTLTRTPVAADTDNWIVGLVEDETREDSTDATNPTIIQHQNYTYVPDSSLVKSITREIKPRTPSGTSDDALTSYEYDDYGNVVQVTDPEGRVTQICYDGDSTFHDDTDCPDVTATATHGLAVAAKDALGEVTSFAWQIGGRSIRSADQQYSGNQKGTEVDALGRPVESWVQPSGHAPQTLLAAQVYHDDPDVANSAGRPYMERFKEVGDGTAIRSAVYVDGLGRKAWTVAPKTPEGKRFGRATTLRDHAGRPLETTLSVACTEGGADCTNLEDASASSTPSVVTVYDALGRPTTVTGPDGVSAFIYRQADFSIPTGPDSGTTVALDVVLAKDPNGNLTEELRDGGRLILANECSNTVSPALIDLSAESCSTPDSTYYTYWASGEIETIYDATVYGPDGSGDYANSAHRIQFKYDTLGRRLETQDPDAGTSLIEYDRVGNIRETTDARNLVVSYEYDALNRIKTIDRPAGTGEMDLSITYDPITRQRARVTSNSGYQETWAYDDFGRLEQNVKTEFSQSMVTDYESDLLGRPTMILYPVMANFQGWTGITYRYQGAYLVALCGDRDLATCTATPSKYYMNDVDYDSLGRIETIHEKPGNLDYSYYAFGDTDPGRSVHALKSMVLGGGQSHDLSYEYDPRGNVTQVTDAHSSMLGNCSGSLEDCDDASASYLYDPRNRLSSWTREVGAARPTQHFAYDVLGNLVGRDLPSAGAAPNQTYAEDPAPPHQLTTSHSGKTYTYDASGNVDYRDGVYFTYNSSGKLVCQGAAAGQCAIAYRYDMDGNLLSKTTASSQEYYFGKIFQWFPASQKAYLNAYAFGRRLTRHYLKGEGVYLRNATAPTFPFVSGPSGPSARPWLLGALTALTLLLLFAHWGALEPLAEHPISASLALGLAALIAIPQPLWGMSFGGGRNTLASKVLYVFQDHRGTEVLTTDTGGVVKQWRVFEPFGETLASWTGNSSVERSFEGHQWDDDLGLYNFGARWYDSDSGRFMAVDPMIPDATNPQDHNPYGYVLNNPVNLTDPTGMCRITCFGIGTAYDKAPRYTLDLNIKVTLTRESKRPITGLAKTVVSEKQGNEGQASTEMPAPSQSEMSTMDRAALMDGSCVDCTPVNREAEFGDKAFDASELPWFGMIWDSANPPPISKENWEAAQASCAANGCNAVKLGAAALVAAPAVNALVLRGVVALGPAGPDVVNALSRRGGELAAGAGVPGPPRTFFEAAGFAASRAFSFVRDSFSRD
jgi:RHS repeat-associated protein